MSHHHEHSHACGCGEHHHAEHHAHACGCGGHHHTEHHAHACGCGGHHHTHTCGCGEAHTHRNAKPSVEHLTPKEQEFLALLQSTRYLPVAQFVVKSTKESAFETIALAPVFITNPANSMAFVKETGTMLKKLEADGYITLDYDIPLHDYDYDEYKQSAIFSLLQETVAEASQKEGFLGDIAHINRGSIALCE